MKSYTDIEQSKKLAEILPIESADMEYILEQWIDEKTYQHKEEYSKNPVIKVEDDCPLQPITHPCWSLVALLDVIPKEVKIKGQRYAPCLFPTTDGHWLYRLWHNSNEIIESPIAIWSDNSVDACYEMILKLHENKML